jgi:hypothetical protein
MLGYDLACMIQKEYRQEVEARRLIANAARTPRRRLTAAVLEAAPHTRQRLGVYVIRLGLSLAGRDVPVDAGST